MNPVAAHTDRFLEAYRAREMARNEYVMSLARNGWSAHIAMTVQARRKVQSADIDFQRRADELGEALALYGADHE